MLLRHAKAVASAHSDGEAGDHARDLSERGRRDASALGRLVQQGGLQPALALVSGALRTRRTWDLLAPFTTPEPQLVVTDRLYLASIGELRAVLRETSDDIASVILVGHNPGLHELAVHLAGDAGNTAGLSAGPPTCSLIGFDVTGSWSELGPDATSNLMMMRP